MRVYFAASKTGYEDELMVGIGLEKVKIIEEYQRNRYWGHLAHLPNLKATIPLINN